MRLTAGAAVLLTLLLPGISSALEPVTALDDGFAIPSPPAMSEAAASWPGSELFAGGPFAVVAWNAPYGMTDLAVSTAVAGTRIGRAGISASWSGTDFDLYGDDHETFGFSYLFGGRLAIGARIARSALRIEGFGTASATGVDAGFVFRPTERLVLAAAMEDLTGAELGESREPLDGNTRAGVTWTVPGSCILLASVSKTRRFDASFSGGVLMETAPSLTVGVLGANEPDRVEFLAALGGKGLRFSYRGSFHRDLGFTHGFSVSGERGATGD